MDSTKKPGSLQTSVLACLELIGPVSGASSEGSFQIPSPSKVHLYRKRKEREQTSESSDLCSLSSLDGKSLGKGGGGWKRIAQGVVDP